MANLNFRILIEEYLARIGFPVSQVCIILITSRRSVEFTEDVLREWLLVIMHVQVGSSRIETVLREVGL